MPYYPNPYGGIGTGINSAATSITEALRKMEEMKRQQEWDNMLRSFMGGQGQGTTPPTVTDWGSNVTAGQPAGTLPPPQTYGGTQYGAPVDWSKWTTGEATDAGGSKGGGGGMMAGGNKGGGGG